MHKSPLFHTPKKRKNENIEKVYFHEKCPDGMEKDLLYFKGNEQVG